ncbi:2-dehydro-3-deoxygalactonokinase [Lysobacter enzymogenes]|uniref:2-dehydro-3-deoxygalactonokinase n=1 Tax=Lysobacter enzymogenes TaxID=69 RepID=UPI00099D87A7|nr:2-dehydro-3-deoxygalactonokinase [Lysobacter enzymogenes]UZW61300.1 2-dehydro-3-deoxygalactonokinase [Lysobacter enzymogenes]
MNPHPFAPATAAASTRAVGAAPRAGADLGDACPDRALAHGVDPDGAQAAPTLALRGRADDAAFAPGLGRRAAAARTPPGPQIALIGVDWGPTRVRAHAFDSHGGVLATRDSARGMAGLANADEFSAALDELLGAELDDGRAPILLAGMVGARQGWQEAPYAALPADADAIAAMLQPLRFRGRHAAIVPGVCGPAVAGFGIDAAAAGFADVMRGEETQAMGVPPGTARAVAPGAHSKWLRLRAGAVVGFSSYPTGELYSLLLEQSLLGRGLPAQAWSERGFALGLDTARAQPDWLHQLFGVRARHVRDAAPAEELPAFLSGLLIGYECLAAQAADPGEGEIAIVGDARPAAIYAQALRRYGQAHYIVEGDTAFCRGLWRIARAAGYA